MRLHCLILATVSLLVMSCGKQAAHLTPRGRQGNPPLSKADTDFFHDLNQAYTDTQDAVSLAFHPSSEGPSILVSQKAAQIADKLKQVCTAGVWHEPGADFKTNWNQTIDASTTCPLSLSQSGTYVDATKTWALDAQFANLTEEFRNLIEIKGYTLTGRIHVDPPKKDSTNISIRGYLDIRSLSIPGKAELTVHLTIHHILAGTALTSIAAGTISFADHWQHTLAITGVGDNKTYYVDGHRYSAKDFGELFSFLRMDEIMDKSKDMR